MANVVDSKQEPLPAPTILIMAAQDLDLKGVTVEAAMLGLAHELSMPNVDQVQVGIDQHRYFSGSSGADCGLNRYLISRYSLIVCKNNVYI